MYSVECTMLILAIGLFTRVFDLDLLKRRGRPLAAPKRSAGVASRVGTMPLFESSLAIRAHGLAPPRENTVISPGETGEGRSRGPMRMGALHGQSA
jgi:hypothetical protein